LKFIRRTVRLNGSQNCECEPFYANFSHSILWLQVYFQWLVIRRHFKSHADERGRVRLQASSASRLGTPRLPDKADRARVLSAALAGDKIAPG
jgi:hypothetical protein